MVIVSLAIVIVVVTSSSTPFFQPRSGLQPEHDEAEKTRIATINDSSSNQTAATTTITPTTIDIVSTASAFPFVQRWAAQYENQQLASSGNVNVDYLADREIIVAEVGSGSSNLAIVGVPDENNNTLYIPVSAQAVAIVYNIPSFPDIPSGLRLNSTILFLILNGSITRWDDAAIKDLNPSLNLPDERIVVVHSGDDDNNSTNTNSSSSSLMLLNQYLGRQSLSWPKNDSITTSGPSELAEMVRKIPYSVGYVDFSYAIQTRMTYAAIADANGDFVIPSTESIGRAVNVGLQFHNSVTDQSPSQQPPTVNASRLVNGSYPIVGVYYASLLVGDDKEERNLSTLDFVEWIISEGGGQQILLEVQYPLIYPGNEQLATYAKTTLDTIQKSQSN